MAGDKKSDDQWVMSTPTDKKVSDFLVGDNLDDEIFGDSNGDDTSLEKELEHWGMDIPSVLLSGDSEENQEITETNDNFNDLKIPGVIDGDLDFLDAEKDFDEVLNNIDEIDGEINTGSESSALSSDHEDNLSSNENVDDAITDDGDSTSSIDDGDSTSSFDDIDSTSSFDEVNDLDHESHFEEEENEDQHHRPQKGSILDHLGKNFFDEESDDNEHSLSSLVGEVEEDETHEIDSNLKELSSALSGENLSTSEEVGDEELFPDSDDLEYPDMGEMNAGSESSEDETLLPQSDDLEYPDDLGMSSGEDELKAEKNESRPQLTPADELSPSEDEDAVEQTDPSYNLTQELKNDLEKEIESDDVDPDDFWATGDFPKMKKTLEKPITEVQASKQIKEDFFKDIDDEDNFKIIPSQRFSSITLDEVSPQSVKGQEADVFDKEAEERIVESVKEALAPKIEKVVRDLFAEKIEKVAWEVIPDLAKILLRLRLKKSPSKFISPKIQRINKEPERIDLISLF